MFERCHQPLVSMRRFIMRLIYALLIVVGIDLAAVILGTIGYREFAGMGWLSAGMDAVMVITGNGLVTPVKNEAGKIFAMCDALIGVVVFITAAGMVLAPVIHRIMHTLHLESQDRAH